MTYHLNFCESNITVWTVWYKNGLSRCFYDVHTSIFMIMYTTIFSVVHLYRYRKCGTRVDPRLKPRSNLYLTQLIIHILFVLWPFLDLTLYVFKLLSNDELYGRTILATLAGSYSWSLCTMCLLMERNYINIFQSGNGRRHSVILMVFWITYLFVVKNLAMVSINGETWFWKLQNKLQIAQFAIFVVEYLLAVVLVVLGMKAPGLPSLNHWRRLENERMVPQEDGSTFTKFFAKLKTLFPYLWPKNSLWLQARVLTCCALLIAGRVVNLYVPIYHKWIVDSLSEKDEHKKIIYRWDLILIYVMLLLAQGGAMSGGLLATARSFLWIRVQQFTTIEVQIHLYQHLHKYFLFNIIPTVVDIIIAIVYFTSSFNAWFGLIVLITMVLYFSATVYLTEWRTKYRRNMNRLDNEAEAKAVDSLLNFETVKYYNAEEYEVERYRESLIRYQTAEWLDNASLSLLSLLQNIIITGGLLAGSMLCAWFVVKGEMNFTVGSYVLFAGYIMQLYQPLNWLGTYYRMIQKSFIDMENMFALLKQDREVADTPDAAALQVKEGRIEFKDVSFHYMVERPILKNISFTVDAGKTVALVGHSGAGKSTIMRLLFRFYNVNRGGIYIDGQNIAKVTQKSLRQHIGVVPQDTVLFNDSIKYNIRYGRVTASDNELFDAAQAAEIHERIISFPEGYDTVVGERGLKLSGGEKQRVAIARTILKAPTFVLLDEATSALDTHTERLIQSSLDKVCMGRTTVVIAHRLSTIIHADEILVFKEGEIVERGRHEDLLDVDGHYATMWRQQLEKMPISEESALSRNQSRAKLASNNNENEDENGDENDI